MRHVLVVEDDESYAYAVARVLAHAGLRVTVAHQGLDALEADDRDPADLILLDLRLPDMHGTDVALDLRARRPRLPIVVLSGYAAEMGLVPANLVLRKPLEPQSIPDMILPLCAA
jgi:DNA-binding response OmpR family regulator